MTTTMQTMTSQFLEAILPTMKDGYLTGAVGHGGHFNGAGKYEFDKFVPFHFQWPDQAVEAVAHIQKHAAVADVYICPYLQETPERRKGNAAWRALVHCDVDGVVDLNKVHEIGGFIVWSGTPGHGHVYVLLSYPVTPVQHEMLCKGLVAHLGGDPGKVSDNDLMRPPGTFNHKAGLLFITSQVP